MFKFLRNCILFVFCLLLIFSPKGCPSIIQRPNIVLIVIDALRADHLPFYGYPRNTAPILASLAEKSIVFENAYSAATFTVPAIASLFTSFFPTQHGLILNSLIVKQLQMGESEFQTPVIPLKMETIAEFLKKKGYRTLAVSHNTFVSSKKGFARGFDVFETLPYDLASEGAVELNNEIRKIWDNEVRLKQPYFLYIHYMDPHFPYHEREPWYQDTSDKQKDLMAYDSEIGYVDRNIGSLFHILEWEKNTLVIITADHGEAFNDHDVNLHGNSLYQETLHVPLLFYFPQRYPKGDRITANVSTLDIYPTLQEITGTRPNKIFKGQSLLPLLEKAPGLSNDRYIYAHSLPYVEPFTSVIHKNWKYIQSANRKELYNLREDPGEKNNLYLIYPALARTLQNQLTDFINNCKPFKPDFTIIPQKDDPVQELKALGYIQ